MPNESVYPIDYATHQVNRSSVASSKVSDAADVVKDAATDAADAGRVLAGQLAAQTAEYAGKLEEFAKSLPPALAKSLKDQPLTTLAAASLVGFLLGAVLKK